MKATHGWARRAVDGLVLVAAVLMLAWVAAVVLAVVASKVQAEGIELRDGERVQWQLDRIIYTIEGRGQQLYSPRWPVVTPTKAACIAAGQRMARRLWQQAAAWGGEAISDIVIGCEPKVVPGNIA